MDRLTSPAIQVLQLIPRLAWIPVALLLFGVGENATRFMIAVTAFAPIAINVTDAFVCIIVIAMIGLINTGVGEPQRRIRVTEGLRIVGLETHAQAYPHELIGIWQRLYIPVILVTHNADEAVYLADRVIIWGRRHAAFAASFTSTCHGPGAVHPKQSTTLPWS